MKFLFLLFLAFGTTVTCYAQDVIKARNGAEFQAKVLEVLPNHIKYQAPGNPTAPVLTVSKAELVWIRFGNGIYEYLNPDPFPHRPAKERLLQPKQAHH